ncbi:MAG: hypothetical protein QOA19_11570 [Nitrososphaeraceae archaeon]|nr:hypothetical protein [Nitrososphaeraceae archaeon]MDW0272021.1 hypothetical protein [Nitrososphaeraceae archaeon]
MKKLKLFDSTDMILINFIADISVGRMTKIIMLTGLVLNLVASILIGYGRIFRSKKAIQKESQTNGIENTYEEKRRLIETRVAQIGAGLLAIGFAVQIWGNITES